MCIVLLVSRHHMIMNDPYYCFPLLKAQEDYISQLQGNFKDLQRYAVTTEEVIFNLLL